MRQFLINLLFCFFIVATPCFGEEVQQQNDDSFVKKTKCLLCTIWQSDDYSLLIPLNTWHNRKMYDKENTDSYNERPWGIGLAKEYIDSDNNRHSLFFMEFQDSHNHVEPFVGYSKVWRYALSKENDIYLTGGGLIGITAREDYSYIPFPGALPIAGFEVKNVIFESTYIPGGRNNGNVLFSWMRLKF